MALYTGKGDDGASSLFDSPKGVRTPKSDPLFEALGTCDELTSVVGWVKAHAKEETVDVLGEPLAKVLHGVQDVLFTIQAELAGAPKTVPETDVRAVEARIHFIEKTLPPITTFLVPGATELSARLDVARTLARRVERRVVSVHEAGVRSVGEGSRRYLNRLSSLFYALVRYVNHMSGAEENAPAYRG